MLHALLNASGSRDGSAPPKTFGDKLSSSGMYLILAVDKCCYLERVKLAVLLERDVSSIAQMYSMLATPSSVVCPLLSSRQPSQVVEMHNGFIRST